MRCLRLLFLISFAAIVKGSPYSASLFRRVDDASFCPNGILACCDGDPTPAVDSNGEPNGKFNLPDCAKMVHSEVKETCPGPKVGGLAYCCEVVPDWPTPALKVPGSNCDPVTGVGLDETETATDSSQSGENIGSQIYNALGTIGGKITTGVVLTAGAIGGAWQAVKELDTLAGN